MSKDERIFALLWFGGLALAILALVILIVFTVIVLGVG
jgi:predicted nucleic acid-binding Zn ribbon protein